MYVSVFPTDCIFLVIFVLKKRNFENLYFYLFLAHFRSDGEWVSCWGLTNNTLPASEWATILARSQQILGGIIKKIIYIYIYIYIIKIVNKSDRPTLSLIMDTKSETDFFVCCLSGGQFNRHSEYVNNLMNTLSHIAFIRTNLCVWRTSSKVGNCVKHFDKIVHRSDNASMYSGQRTHVNSARFN